MSNRFHNITVIRISKSCFFFLFFFIFFRDWFTVEKKMLNKFRTPQFIVSSDLCFFFFSIDVALLSVLPAALWHIWMSVLMKSHRFVYLFRMIVFFFSSFVSSIFCHFGWNFDGNHNWDAYQVLLRGSIQWIHTSNCIENANRSNRRHENDLMFSVHGKRCCFFLFTFCVRFFFFVSIKSVILFDNWQWAKVNTQICDNIRKTLEPKLIIGPVNS